MSRGPFLRIDNGFIRLFASMIGIVVGAKDVTRGRARNKKTNRTFGLK